MQHQWRNTHKDQRIPIESVYGTYKIGEYWDKILNCENRGRCGLCDLLKSMEHILLECRESPMSRIIWEVASDLWLKRETEWPEICIGTIFGCNLAVLHDTKGKNKPGATRLFKIIVLELAHLIWKLRCECTIKYGGDNEKYHSDSEILNQWIHVINTRQNLIDCSPTQGDMEIKRSRSIQYWKPGVVY